MVIFLDISFLHLGFIGSVYGPSPLPELTVLPKSRNSALIFVIYKHTHKLTYI